MLVLSRRTGEGIRIGDNIIIRVVSKPGTDKIRLGIDAPRDVPIVRGELIDDRAEMVQIQCEGRLPSAVYAGRWLFRKRVRESVFKPSYLEYAADYIQAHDEDQTRRQRLALCAIFAMRALGLYLGCLGATFPPWLLRRASLVSSRFIGTPPDDEDFG